MPVSKKFGFNLKLPRVVHPHNPQKLPRPQNCRWRFLMPAERHAAPGDTQEFTAGEWIDSPHRGNAIPAEDWKYHSYRTFTPLPRLNRCR